jgi:hypothetical protein
MLYSPGDDTRNSGICSSHAEKCTEVFYAFTIVREPKTREKDNLT